MSGFILRVITSYLYHRLQVKRVFVDTSSPLIKVKGVPQNSFLGLLLFTSYTTDLPNYVAHCTAHLYADDCQLHLSYELSSHSGAIGMLNTDLESMRTWSTTTA